MTDANASVETEFDASAASEAGPNPRQLADSRPAASTEASSPTSTGSHASASAAGPAQTADPSDTTRATASEGDDDKLVPATEAIRDRERAQQAEDRLGDARQQMQSLQSQLDQARQTIDHLERRQKMDALLAEAEPIDTEAARLLTEQTVQQMDEPDVQSAVEELRQRRPYLFRESSQATGSTMAARADDDAMPASEQAAEQAAMSGDRRDLLRYLRLRRGR